MIQLKSFKKCILYLLAVLILMSFSGCGNKTETSGGQVSGQYGDSYPLEGSPKITYWMQLNSALLNTDSEMATTPFAQGLQEETGIEIEFIHPSPQQVGEQFNIMLASGDLPDVIEWIWYNFPGGPQKAINDGYILALNDVFDKYSPNIKKYIEENQDVDKMLQTDERNYYVYPFIRGDEILKTYSGPVARADWMKELNISAPETLDDWEAMLKAFKENKQCDTPLQYDKDLMWAFGVKDDFYFQGDEIVYGPIQPEYKAFVTKMNQWLKDGLMTTTGSEETNPVTAAFVSGKTGVAYSTGGTIAKWMQAGVANNPAFDIVGLKYPVLQKGEKSKFIQRDYSYALSGQSAAISATSKNVEAAARLLDYGYSPEGNRYFNFGKEGVTYNMVGDYPTYTDVILNNPEGLAPVNALARNVRAGYSGPFIQKKEYLEQYYNMPQQMDALETWCDEEGNKSALPLITYTTEESNTVATVMNDVKSHVDEMTMKFIVGAEPLENFDKYVETIKKLNIDEIIQIQKKAVDRYNAR